MDLCGNLNQTFQALEAKDLFSGVVLITKGAKTLYSGAFGYASQAWKLPNSMETRFDTASITKIFTTVAVLQLIDQNRLDFDTKAVA